MSALHIFYKETECYLGTFSFSKTLKLNDKLQKGKKNALHVFFFLRKY